MFNHVWFFAALACALLWGLSYTLTEKVLERGLPISVLMVFTGSIFLIFSIIISVSTGELKSGIIELINSKNNLILLIITSTIYVMGSYLIFKDIQINLWGLLGGILIFIGIAVIYLKGT